MKKKTGCVAVSLVLFACTQQTNGPRSAASVPSTLERGRYLVQIAGCNDCHTPGYMPQAGKVDEKLWLTGDTTGWQGPWGTTYAPNLRLHMQLLTEDQWLQEARTRQMRPPMPWYQLRVMPDEDLRAIYRFTRSLGEPGKQAPAYLPPGTDPPPPYFKAVLPPAPAG